MTARQLFASILLLACAAWPACAEPDPEKLLLYDLLDLNKSALFAPDPVDPLTEMTAMQELYASLRERATTDASPDRHHLKLFLFAGWSAIEKGEFATVEAFNSDLRPLFDTRADDVLTILADAEFMLPSVCTTLAKHFYFEDANPEERTGFMSRHREAIKRVLGEERAARCEEAFWAVKS